MRSINRTHILIGSAALFLGFLLYLINRFLDDTYLGSIIDISNKARYWDNIFLNKIGGVLPSFLHVFAFSLLLGGLLRCRKIGYIIICSSWLFINIIFELGQRHAIAASHHIPKWFDGVFILENVKSYFLNGTFDFYDLLASFAGAAAALWVMLRTLKDRRY